MNLLAMLVSSSLARAQKLKEAHTYGIIGERFHNRCNRFVRENVKQS